MVYKYKKEILMAVCFLISALIFRSSFIFYSEYRMLKKELKRNKAKVDSIEKIKKGIFIEIKKDSFEIEKREKIIKELRDYNINLKKNLKHYRNENKRLKNNYSNNTIEKRISIFAKLATEKDTLQ